MTIKEYCEHYQETSLEIYREFLGCNNKNIEEIYSAIRDNYMYYFFISGSRAKHLRFILEYSTRHIPKPRPLPK